MLLGQRVRLARGRPGLAVLDELGELAAGDDARDEHEVTLPASVAPEADLASATADHTEQPR